jgi:thiamine-monophosphate kinase
MDELARIAMLARVLGASRASGEASREVDGVEVGIGDDAAVLAPRPGRLVWTIDEQVEGVHFRRDLVSWRDVGWRAYMAAVSDVAAMGASPWCALASIVVPDDVDDAALEAVARGQKEAADVAGAPLVGGNLARGPAMSIATTLLGTCEQAVQRRGARPGDGLWMAGRVGCAAAGLRALERGKGADPGLAAPVEAWRTPRACLVEGRAMAGRASAAVDVSDGLARDANHLGRASDVRVVLDEAALLEDGMLLEAAKALGDDALDLALHGGEDYALVAASDRPIPGFRRIGEVRAGRGLVLRSASGERAIEPAGFDHFTR